MRPSLRALPATAARHASVGVLCAALNIGIVYVCAEVFGWHYLAAIAVTVLITVPVSYVLHRRISFRLSYAASLAEAGRFLAQQCLQLVAGTLLLGMGVEILGLAPAVAMAAAVLVLWVFALAMHFFWVFAHSARGT
jgi:putative flippase GtrA